MKKIILMTVIAMLVVSGQSVKADEILELKNRIVEIQNHGKLGFRNFVPCSQILTYASYVPLEKPEVKQGGEIQFYFEPNNFYTHRKGGRYEIWLSEDMFVFTADGEVLLEQKEAATHHYFTETPIMDLYFTNSVSVGQLPPGRYVFRAVLNDKLKGATATKELSFYVVK
jgi:hypothetical protein